MHWEAVAAVLRQPPSVPHLGNGPCFAVAAHEPELGLVGSLDEVHHVSHGEEAIIELRKPILRIT